MTTETQTLQLDAGDPITAAQKKKAMQKVREFLDASKVKGEESSSVIRHLAFLESVSTFGELLDKIAILEETFFDDDTISEENFITLYGEEALEDYEPLAQNVLEAFDEAMLQWFESVQADALAAKRNG